VVLGVLPEILQLLLELQDRFFEIQVMFHGGTP
jgi:hypothetical protein